MNSLAQILPLAHVQVNVEASSKKRAFEFAGLLFENHLGLARSVVTDNLFARERLGSTGLGQGMAIPHGRIKGLRQPSAALVRLSSPVPFEAPDNQPVQLLVFLLVPESASGKHLELLSVIAEMLSDDAFRHRMLEAPDAVALHRLVRDWASLQHAA